MNNRKTSIALAAGGTGGHLFPAQSVAEEFTSKGYRAILICDQRTKDFVKGKLASIDSFKIFAPRPGGTSILDRVVNLIKIIPTVLKVRRYLKTEDVRAVVGFGGYPSLPTLLAALSLKLPTYIHEQNSVLGSVNRLMAPFVKAVFTSFPTTRNLNKKYLKKTLCTGMPIRDVITQHLLKPQEDKDDKIVILVIGGSQGAKILSEIVPVAISQLDKALQKRITVYQQARLNMVHEAKRLYSATECTFIVETFFENIGELISQSDLIIARAGASTIAEIAAFKKQAILIPLAIATDNHQLYNSKLLESAGLAKIVEENVLHPVSLSRTITEMLTKNTRSGKNESELFTPNASKTIVQHILSHDH